MEEQGIDRGATEPRAQPLSVVQYVYLLGTPPIREFLEFVRCKRMPEDTAWAADQALVKDWHRAADVLREAEAVENGLSASSLLLPLPPELQRLAERELEDPGTARSLNLLPHRWALVDLDQLVVHQRSVDLTYIESLRTALPTDPTDEEVFLFAAGRLCPPPAVRVTRASETVYTFSSVSSDLRFLDFALLDPKSVNGYHPPGSATGVVGVFIGFGVNILSALRVRDRLILINGTHRAHVLYSLGIRQVPCLVREVSGEEDLDLIGAIDVKQSLPVYLRAGRPPRLKDFFDPRLHAIIPAAAATRLVHVQLNTQRSRV
jgi:hypothetical protein